MLKEWDSTAVSERAASVDAPHHDDSDLVTRLVAFDASAWRQLFDENYGRVYAYAFVRLGRRADAEDVASNVFAEAAKGIGSFRYRGVPIVSWLLRIAHHETVDSLKRRAAQPDALAVDPSDARRPIAEVLDRQYLAQALAKMSAEHRELLTLRFIDDLSVREVAGILKKSEGAVKVQQLRALRAMRKHLGENQDG
jgi:RNA polymerase sigma-70 factor, ECF subfamily